jgi:hypothetical protein
MKDGIIRVQHPDMGTFLDVPVHDLETATPAQLVRFLVGASGLPAPHPDRPYEVYHAGKALNMNQNLAANGVEPQSTLQVMRATHGAWSR